MIRSVRLMARLGGAAILVMALLGLDRGQDSPGSAGPSSKTWIGQYREVEEYLGTAECVAMENIGPASPQGVPALRRCVLQPGGPVARMAWKSMAPGIHRGFRQSYKGDIAAYELDKLLKLDMVPPSVEREVQGHTGCATFWVEKTVTAREGTSGPPDRARWDGQLRRMVMFDSLIGNRDRNLANMLRDPAGNLILLDHSRAFGPGTEISADLTQIDRELWDRIGALTRTQLEAALRRWLDDDQIGAIMARRERMRAAIGRQP